MSNTSATRVNTEFTYHSMPILIQWPGRVFFHAFSIGLQTVSDDVVSMASQRGHLLALPDTRAYCCCAIRDHEDDDATRYDLERPAREDPQVE